MNRKTYRQQLHTSINVAPLVDVMLVLLIVFMIGAPMMNGAVRVDLPQERAAPGQDNGAVSVVINEKGSVLLNDQVVTDEALIDQLRVVADAKSADISLYADRHLPYERVMRIVSTMAQSGFSKVRLVVEGAV
jgi:biopolymer transport protein TolR